MAVFETWLKSDLKKPLTVKPLTGNLFSADNQGNLIGVEVMDGGSPAELSGNVTGYAIRADGATLTVSGTLDGNRASIVLPASAYTVIGHISIVIKVDTTTVGACTSYVYQTTTDTIVDPGHVIPSIAELLAQIEACRTATTNANTAASSANTAAGNANTKAGLAETAAGNANTAAGKIDNMTASATTLSAGSQATVSVTEVDGHKHIEFGVPKGESGNETIDDSAGFGDVDKVWSADKTLKEVDSKADAICKTIDTPASIVTIEDGADDLPVNQIKIGIEPVQEGTGDPSPDNVRPITGWTGCNVKRNGADNLIAGISKSNIIKATDGSLEWNTFHDVTNFIAVKPGTAYTLSGKDMHIRIGDTRPAGVRFAYYTSDKTNISVSESDTTSDQITIVTDANTAFVRIQFGKESYDVQFEEGATSTFESYPITFPSSAGTVYGGSLTIHADGTGELVVDRAFFEIDGSGTGYGVGGNTYKYVRYTPESSIYYYGEPTDGISNMFTEKAIGNTNDDIGFGFANGRDIRIRYGLFTELTIAEAKEWLAEHPVQVCYKIASPMPYQLSAPQVRTLLGLNHIWADTGDIESITYPVDTATAIDNQTATTQSIIAGSESSVATESHAIGDVFICDNKLYKAIDAIAVGESIIVGSNVEQTTVADELNAIWGSIATGVSF